MSENEIPKEWLEFTAPIRSIMSSDEAMAEKRIKELQQDLSCRSKNGGSWDVAAFLSRAIAGFGGVLAACAFNPAQATRMNPITWQNQARERHMSTLAMMFLQEFDKFYAEAGIGSDKTPLGIYSDAIFTIDKIA